MSVLLWLVIPLAALIIGIVWAYLIGRPPRPAAMRDSMESFSRFRRALATRHPSGPHVPGTQVPATRSPVTVPKDPPDSPARKE